MYVPMTNSDGTKNYIQAEDRNTNGRYGFDINESGYSGTADIAENIANKWLKQYTEAGYTASKAYGNGNGTAYLLDTNEWAGFKDSTYAQYAVGAPTLELFAASYNKTHQNRTIETQVEELGYDVKWSDGSFGNYRISGLDTTERLYVITDSFEGSPKSMWLASPSAYTDGWDDTYMMMCVNANGDLEKAHYGMDTLCSRPVICLKSSAKLEKQADGNYKIVE